MFECNFVYARDENEHILRPENISSLESRNKSPQFRLIKRTSRAIYNLQSFVALSSYIWTMFFFSVTFGFCFCGFAATAHRINKLCLLFVRKFLLCIQNLDFWNLQIFDTTSKAKQKERQIKRKSTWNRLNIRIQINDIYILLIKIESFPASAFFWNVSVEIHKLTNTSNGMLLWDALPKIKTL